MCKATVTQLRVKPAMTATFAHVKCRKVQTYQLLAQSYTPAETHPGPMTQVCKHNTCMEGCCRGPFSPELEKAQLLGVRTQTGSWMQCRCSLHSVGHAHASSTVQTCFGVQAMPCLQVKACCGATPQRLCKMLMNLQRAACTVVHASGPTWDDEGLCVKVCATPQ